MNTPLFALAMSIVFLLGAGGCAWHQKQPTYDALQATHSYNDYLERTLARIQSLPTESERRTFVNGLRSSLERETARWKDQMDGEMKRGTLPKVVLTTEHQREIARLKTLAPKLTEELGKYVDK